MEGNQVVVAVLQTVGGIVLAGSIAGVTWCIRQIIALGNSHERLKAQVEASFESSRQQFSQLTNWMQSTSNKLDGVQNNMTNMLVKVTEIGTAATVRERLDDQRDERDETRRRAD